MIPGLWPLRTGHLPSISPANVEPTVSTDADHRTGYGVWRFYS